MDEKNQAAKTPFADLKKAALEHYREVSAKAAHWNSFVEKAILAYKDPEIKQLDFQIEHCRTCNGIGSVSKERLGDQFIYTTCPECYGAKIQLYSR